MAGAGLLAVAVAFFVLRGGDSILLAALLFAWPVLALVGDSTFRLATGFSDRFRVRDATSALCWMLALM